MLLNSAVSLNFTNRTVVGKARYNTATILTSENIHYIIFKKPINEGLQYKELPGLRSRNHTGIRITTKSLKQRLLCDLSKQVSVPCICTPGAWGSILRFSKRRVLKRENFMFYFYPSVAWMFHIHSTLAAEHCPGIVRKPIREMSSHATCQGILRQSSQLAEPLWTVPGAEQNCCVQAICI